ncbi:MAG: nicotinate-nucleotide adenylyltransferase [Legionella sp.]
MNNVVIFGGTFDPPHLGHLNTAINVQSIFNFDNFFFLPCKSPVLKKTTGASVEQRLQMLKLALSSYEKFKIDEQEMRRKEPSYMFDTLTNYRRQWGKNIAVTLLLGYDAFLQLPQWYRWTELSTLANLLIISRPLTNTTELTVELAQFVACANTNNLNDLFSNRAGKIFFYDAGCYAISSTEIRQCISENKDISTYLPITVYEYIKNNSLYHPRAPLG